MIPFGKDKKPKAHRLKPVLLESPRSKEFAGGLKILQSSGKL